MYSIIEDRGRQYRAEVGDRLILDRAGAEVGSTIEAPVLFLAGDEGVTVGTPVIAGKKAVLKVIDHPRGPKGIAGTYKRRKDNRRRMGFRAAQTLVEVVSID